MTSRLRWTVSFLAILGTLPYICLKVLWITGSRVGLRDPDFGTDATMQVANALTGVMDAVAIVLALAFVTAWGRRLPAGLVLLPMWIGTGLLAPIAVILPLQLVVGTEPSEAVAEEPIADWVYAMVYAGFLWQAVFLLTGFVLYARSRWGARWSEPLTAAAPRRVAVAVLGLLLVAAGALATRAGDVLGPNLAGDLAMVVLAGVAVVLLLRPGSTPRRTPLVLAWLGSGAMLAWGLYTGTLLTVPNDLVGDRDHGPLALAAQYLRVLSGLAVAALAAHTFTRQARLDRPVAVGESATTSG